MIWVVLILSIYTISTALIMNTADLFSSVIFKIFPFFLGLIVLFYAVKELGWI